MNEHVLLQLAVILASAKLAGEICERWLKQPAVLGELLCGIVLGRSVLGWVPDKDVMLLSLAGLGAILLLFHVGLESDLAELAKVGGSAVWVAAVGAVVQFAAGYAVVAALGYPVIPSLFVSGALTATSIGIAARVFGDLGILQARESQIVLGAAVVDDVIGLIILASVSGLAASQAITAGSVFGIVGLALAFLAGAVIVGLWLTPVLLDWAQRMQTRAAVSSAAMVFCLLMSALAAAARLAPVVGAFAAGLVLARAENRIHFEERLKAVGDLLIPVFFVMMGAQMRLSALDPATETGRRVLAMGLLLLLVTVAAKMGVAITTPGRGLKRLAVGAGMLPRGEVALIFAGVGRQAGAMDNALYAVVVFVVVGTTFVAPPLLKVFAKQSPPS